jgi:hypothetical protein
VTKARPPFRDGSVREPGERSSFDAEARRAEAPASLPTNPPCPFCQGTETEIMSAFGAHASVSAYWCRACGSPFDLLRWR